MKIISENFIPINVFNRSNRELRSRFLFFFVVAVCGYLSVILLQFPYADDNVRYLQNYSVGVIDSARYMPNLLEIPLYMSGIITDAAPFTRIISCFFLAYSAVICLKILKIDLNNKWQVLCAVPVIVNPYMLEVMLYKFDNPYMTLALLMVVAAAYLTRLQKISAIIIAILLLLISMFTYQVAINAYLIIFAYLFINEISSGTPVTESFRKMRHWFGVLSATVCLFLPFTTLISYYRESDGTLIIVPYNFEKLKIIIANISDYFSACCSDWSDNTVGAVFFVLFFGFCLKKIMQTLSNRRSLLPLIVLIISLFLFALCPFGVFTVLNSKIYNYSTSGVRILYPMGILLSIVLLENQKLFEKVKNAKIFFNCILICLCMWILFFLNSAGNLIHGFRLLEQQVNYDIAKDVNAIIKENKAIAKVCVSGHIRAPATENFWRIYPIMWKMIPEWWNNCRLILNSPPFETKSTYVASTFSEDDFREKKLVKKHMWYDIFVLDNELLHVKMKNNFGERFHRFIYVRKENIREKQK